MADTETRQMLPEVQAYITGRDEAAEALNKAERDLAAKYPRRYDYDYSDETRSQRAGYREEINEAHTKAQVAQNEAWNALTQSSEPLVRFIAENCKDYQSYAVEVLRVLPATVDELDELADDQDWCHIWNQFRDRAVEQGLFGEIPKPSEARIAMNTWLREDYGMGRESYNKLNRLVNAVVAEEGASKVAA